TQVNHKYHIMVIMHVISSSRAGETAATRWCILPRIRAPTDCARRDIQRLKRSEPERTSGHRRPRKPKSEFEAGGVVQHLDVGPGAAGSGSEEAGAEPLAGHAGAALEPIKALEDVPALRGRNSRAVVGHRNGGAVVAPGNLDRHVAGITTMLE